MRGRLVLLVVLTTAFLSVFAADPPETAKVIYVTEHSQGRISHWEGRVPIYDGRPVYDIALQWNKKTYRVRYESLTGYYPIVWAAGKDIRVKRERGQFLLYRDGEAIPAREVSASDCVQANHPSVPVSGIPGVPCE